MTEPVNSRPAIPPVDPAPKSAAPRNTDREGQPKPDQGEAKPETEILEDTEELRRRISEVLPGEIGKIVDKKA